MPLTRRATHAVAREDGRFRSSLAVAMVCWTTASLCKFEEFLRAVEGLNEPCDATPTVKNPRIGTAGCRLRSVSQSLESMFDSDLTGCSTFFRRWIQCCGVSTMTDDEGSNTEDDSAPSWSDGDENKEDFSTFSTRRHRNSSKRCNSMMIARRSTILRQPSRELRTCLKSLIGRVVRQPTSICATNSTQKSRTGGARESRGAGAR